MSVCTNCIALKLILSCEWKLWQPLLSLQFYQKSTQWNHGNKMWHKKTSTSKPAYTVIRIYWSLLSQKGTWSAEPLDSVPYLPLNIVQHIKLWYYMMQKWMRSFVSLLLQIGIWHLCILVLLYGEKKRGKRKPLFICKTFCLDTNLS